MTTRNPAYQHLLEQLASNRRRREALHREICADTEKILTLGVVEIFREHPDLEAFCWAQRSGEYDDQGPWPGIHAAAYKIGAEGDPTAAQAAIRAFLVPLEAEHLFEMFGEYAVVAADRKRISSHYWEEFDWQGWEEI
jgi:hypothetical protein